MWTVLPACPRVAVVRVQRPSLNRVAGTSQKGAVFCESWNAAETRQP